MGDLNTPLVDEEKMGGLAPDWDSKQDLSSFRPIILSFSFVVRSI